MDPVTYKLSQPIVSAGVELKELIFTRRIKAKDFRGLPAELDQDSNMILISRLTSIEIRFIEELDGYDYIKVSEIAEDFLRYGLKTGPKL